MRISVCRSAAVAAAAVFAVSTTAQAATLVLQQGVNSYAGHLDVQVRPDQVTTSSNTALNVAGYVPTTTPVATIRTLHTWDLSSLPADATITSVTLTLQHRSDSGASTPDDANSVNDVSDPIFELRTISAAITEPPGTTSTTTGSNWNNTFGGTMTLGAILSSANVDPEVGGNLVNDTFASSANFVAAVQAAADSASNQFNFALKLQNETGSDRIVGTFGSNTGNIAGVGISGNADRPILTIDYTTIPEPASIGLLGLAGSCALGRRRRA